MVKRTKKSNNKKNFELVIYQTIKKDNQLPDPKQLKLTSQSMNYHVRKLKEANLVEKLGYGVWKILEDLDEKELKKRTKKTTIVTTTIASRKFTKNKTILRLHSLMFKLNLPNFQYWHRRTSYLDKKQIRYYSFRGNRQSIIHKGVKFHLNSNSITFYCPESINIYGKTARDCNSRAFNWAKKQVLSFSSYLGIDFKKGGKWSLELVRKEIEEVNNELAKDYQDKKEKLEIWDKNDLWLIADKSLRTDNLEFKNNEKCLKDADKITKYFNDIRNNKCKTPTEQDQIINNIEERMDKMLNLIEKQQKIIDKGLNTGWKQWI